MTAAPINPTDYTALAWRMARGVRVPDPAVTTDDVFQQVMVGVVRAVKAYRPDGGAKFLTYAWRCGANAIVDIRRTNRPRMTAQTDYEPTVTPAPTLDDADLCDRLLAVLSKRDRKIVARWMRGEGYTRIGKRYGLTYQGVGLIVRNAIERMRATSIAGRAA